ncbi:metallophosphoesterase family protein [Saccharomonospora piscinae]|uniref:metallophosphoesterase family protein n=1 Tax=Saccharomonospora piscinae TaxID=687388 RepID=UPI0004664DEE|nr:metallophosphoesterase [Saccharomonospora piscinae]
MRVLVLSDTHVPDRARDLPAPVWREIAEADVTIHAGDWVEEGLLDRIEAVAGRLVAVHGNNDGPALRRRLPEVARVELDGLHVAVVHETGQARGRERRCGRLFPDTDVLVFGHSHIPWDSETENGLRLLNPGSPTDRRRQPAATYLTMEVAAARLHDVRLHALPRR